jgi:hypothetical protein
MFHLINDIRADFAFTGIGLKKPDDRFIYMDDRTYTSTEHNFEGLLEYASLDEALSEFGTLASLVETLSLVKGDVWIMLDPDDVYQLVVSHFRSVYPEADLKTAHLFLRTFYIHHRFVKPANKETIGFLEKLEMPKLSDTERYYNGSQHGDGYGTALKENLGYEFLLAHSVAVDFELTDTYVNILANKIERMLWISFCRDVTHRRLTAFYGGFQLKKTLGIPVVFGRNDIEKQLEAPAVKRFFDGELTYKNINRAKGDYHYLLQSMRQIDHLAGYHDVDQLHPFDFLSPTEPMDAHRLKELIALDKQFLWSMLFEREKVTKDTNGVFVNFVYNATPEELKPFIIT